MSVRGDRDVGPGLRLGGRYRLGPLLGAGGMAEVHEAIDERTGRAVAVKVLPVAGATPGRDTERFLRELRVASEIRRDGRPHPNVVQAFDGGIDAVTGVPYVVMELLQGPSLAGALALRGGQPYPLEEAMELVLPLLDALACVHEQGIVHRDFKPDNVILVPSPHGGAPTPKLIDFGVARMLGARLTGTGETLGTMAYLAPETLAASRDATPRADVWSAGVLLHEMLTGENPFEEDSGVVASQYARICNGEPPSLAAAGSCPPWIDAVIRRALSKDPDARHADAGVLRAALARALAPASVLWLPSGRTQEGGAGAGHGAWTVHVTQDVTRLEDVRAALDDRGIRHLRSLVWSPCRARLSELARWLRSPVCEEIALVTLGAGAADGAWIEAVSEAFPASVYAWSMEGGDLAGTGSEALLRATFPPGLRVLGLRGTAVDDDWAEALLASGRAARLAQIDLRDTRVTEPVRARVEAACRAR